MADKLTPEQIREHWTEQARTHGQSPAASWTDVWAIDLEIREIVKRLADGDRVLDVGCGTGYSTVQFAAHKQISVRGIDYVPDMIDQARARRETSRIKLSGSAEFAVGDVTQLNERSDTYDKVVTVRVLISLAKWEIQRAALLACGRVTKPGGLLLLSEATIQGWDNLNAYRAEWSLPPVPMPSFNLYLDEAQVVTALAQDFDLVEIANFSSTYFVGTRILKPLLIEALHNDVEVADPNLHWNRWWSMLPAWGDYGTQKLFVFRKR